MFRWIQDLWAELGKGKFILISITSIGAFLGGWELLVYGLEIPIVILPGPLLITSALYHYFISGELVQDVIASSRRIFLGLGLGSLLGISAGLFIGWYPHVRAAIYPLVAATMPIPKVALVPLMIIWFGLGDAHKIVLVISGVFYIMVINTIAGVNSINPVIIMACKNLGASNGDIFRKVVLPGSLPIIFAALRISFSVSFILVIASEMITSEVGIGYFIADAGSLLETEKVFAGLMLTGILGFLVLQLIEIAEKRFLPWHKRD